MSDLTADVHKDVRLIQRALAKGFMSRAAAEKLVKDLPDSADKADWIDIDGDGGAAAAAADVSSDADDDGDDEDDGDGDDTED